MKKEHSVTVDSQGRRNLLLGAAVASVGALIPARFALAADNTTFKATSGETVYFRGWQFKPDVVVNNVNRYNSLNDGHVDYQTITGDYPALMEKSLIAKDKLDVVYGNPPTLVRFMEAGWIAPADDLPNAAAAKADMYENIREMWTYKGKLLGLGYFASIRGIVAVNRIRQKEVGLSDQQLPKNWDEFYAQLDTLTAKGHKNLYLPHWFNEYYGCSWSFLFEVLNRGGSIVDPKTSQPVVSEAGPAGAVLRAWKKAWNAGQIPEEILSYTEANLVDGFASGRYLFSPQASYNIAYFNDPLKSKISGNVGFLPYAGQGWGLMDSALYVKTARQRDPALDADVNKFVSWYGYKDNDGKIFVGSRWLKEAMVFSAYKSVMESPETAETMKKFLSRESDVQDMLTLYKNTRAPVDVWGTVWAEEFNSFLKRRLPEFLLKNQPVASVINDITAQVNSLNKKYKIIEK